MALEGVKLHRRTEDALTNFVGPIAELFDIEMGPLEKTIIAKPAGNHHVACATPVELLKEDL
jgi:hypothetical protein